MGKALRREVGAEEVRRRVTTPYLRISRLTKKFGAFTALDDISLEIVEGEFVCFLGPSGCGKTTLLRAIAGLDIQTTGRIEQNGRDISALPPTKRDFGIVFQSYALFPNLTAAKNVAYGLENARMPRAALAKRVLELLDLMGLATHGNKYPAQLSGGQQQRVALARALATSPGLLLLDEPLSALDARTRLEVRAELRRHLAEFTGPTLIVTHDPLEAIMLTDRLLVLEDGRIVQQGTPASVARRPATNYVARLVGVNLYRGIRSGATAIALADGGRLVAAGLDETLPAGTPPLLVAVRPSAVVLHTSRPEHTSARNVWPGTVTGLEPLADRVRVEVAGAPGALVDVTPDAVADLRLAEGRSVWLSVKATEVDVYPDPAF